jgi:cysteine-S-conjugate beta-lyase
MIGSVAAFTQAPPWLDAAVAQIDQNRGLPGKLLKDQLPDVGYAPGSAAFLAWLDCRGLGLGDDPAAAFSSMGRSRLALDAISGIRAPVSRGSISAPRQNC